MNIYRVSADVQTRKPVSGFLKAYAIYTFAFILLLAPLAYLKAWDPARVNGHYPQEGLFKMSLNKTADRGQVGMSSNRYDSDILNAYAKVRSSTTGYPEMSSSIWPNGYYMVQNNWSGSWNKYVDILLYFTNRGSGESPGENIRYTVPTDYCAAWGQLYPCGQRPTIYINTYFWDSSSYQSNLILKQRLIMHETGHSVGMKDYCGGDSIMNNGRNDPVYPQNLCNPYWNSAENAWKAKWTQVMSYQPTDRVQVNSIYQ